MVSLEMITSKEAVIIFKMLPMYKKQIVLQRLFDYQMEKRLYRFVEPMPEWETENVIPYDYEDDILSPKSVHVNFVNLEDIINSYIS